MRRVKQVVRRRVFVGCEGDGERSYIVLVARHLEAIHKRVHLDPQLLQPGGGDPLDLVRRAEQVIKKNERTREPYDEKYLLIDSDLLGASPDRDNKIQPILSRLNAKIIWQRPAREALLLRHLPGCATKQPPSTAAAMQQLLHQWPEYQKNMPANQLAARLDLDALRRASEVEAELREFLTTIGMLT